MPDRTSFHKLAKAKIASLGCWYVQGALYRSSLALEVDGVVWLTLCSHRHALVMSDLLISAASSSLLVRIVGT